jgi:hypothetical protein
MTIILVIDPASLADPVFASNVQNRARHFCRILAVLAKVQRLVPPADRPLSELQLKTSRPTGVMLT